MTKTSLPHSAGASPALPGRRQFFRVSAQAAGALSAMALLPASIQRALAIPAAVDSGTIQDIKHVVILMQENRSFDHYFGTMRGVRGFGDRFPIPLANGKPVFFQPNPAGGQDILPFRRDSRISKALIGSGTPHNFPDQQAAWNQGKMDRWIQFKNQATMGFFMREDIPFQFALADAFTVCDGYHCSILTGTDPNRIVFWSGANANPELRKLGINCTDTDSEPVNSRCWPSPSNWVAGRVQEVDGSGQIDPVTGTYNYKYKNNAFKWDTLPDLLERAGVSWHIYQNMNNNWTGAMHGCLAFKSFREAQPGSPIYEHGLTGGPEKADGAVNFLAQLKQDVVNGTLPQVSWVLPTQALAEHPGSSEGVAGAADFIADVLDALTSNPEVWSKTALFVTFDENDGFFDHVAMPAAPSYDANGVLMGKSTVPLDGEYFDASVGSYLKAEDTTTGTVRPWGMSSRVPMYVVSPWSKGGWVNSQVFDHTSVGRFLEQRFGIKVDAISPWSRAVSGDLTTCFDFVTPNDPRIPKLPDTSNYPAINAAQNLLPTAPVTQAPAIPQPLFQETGTRFSRALPYELHTSARLGTDGAVELLFSNTGDAGAVFHVYDKRNLDLIPRRYTVEAGKTLSDTWTGGDYDLWVYSTNGFVRTFAGNTQRGAALEVQVCYEPAGGALYVKVSNHGKARLQAALQANAYRSDGPWTLTVEPGAVAEHHWSIAESGNWYDFTVTAEGFERRFAGRMENGRHGVSDPAMALHL
ncbi:MULTISPECIES: phosphocholine-specific phospholipase C [Achromobacter]|uniref:phospholipase C n=1 Tax=Achromobacter denitrificans TaxID=32002 RepID=A0A6N0JQ85_ACHDE|nr:MULTISPECIES: phospholipase C, phosphocholine-specific [Achromobacter]MDF3849465.1 phospholipase C, phosphocholine-specific [Achromobacter denitrificans]MDF3860825.1 phospholipase C, phosphocholine-specific [Achromobacter denitrificans]QKQ49285.1 phospholipase C, phosphocholine-specific [Achromobacter denitrificans]